MNRCNWCWPHHQVDGRCTIELHELAKSFGIIAASIPAWMDTGRDGPAENSLLWEVIVSPCRGFSRLAYYLVALFNEEGPYMGTVKESNVVFSVFG